MAAPRTIQFTKASLQHLIHCHPRSISASTTTSATAELINNVLLSQQSKKDSTALFDRDILIPRKFGALGQSHLLPMHRENIFGVAVGQSQIQTRGHPPKIDDDVYNDEDDDDDDDDDDSEDTDEDDIFGYESDLHDDERRKIDD